MRYRISYINKGTGPITDLVVNDVVPDFVTLSAGTANCDSTPAGMTCSPVVQGERLNWQMGGVLPGGASGQVSYEVTVDQ